LKGLIEDQEAIPLEELVTHCPLNKQKANSIKTKGEMDTKKPKKREAEKVGDLEAGCRVA